MTLPDIINKHAIYMESREARAVIITDLTEKEELIVVKICLDKSIAHFRSWSSDTPYIETSNKQDQWSLSCDKKSIILDEDFAQGPQMGWQLLIDTETVEKFKNKDDSWMDEWF